MCPPPSRVMALAHPLSPKPIFTTSSNLRRTTIENEHHIRHLESLIRTEREELHRLLVEAHASSPKRHRSDPNPHPNPHPNPDLQPLALVPPPVQPLTPPPPPTLSQPPTPPTPTPTSAEPATRRSPKDVMYPCHPSFPPSTSVSPDPSSAPPSAPHREMAARGSHWSFVEKARFEAALHTFGPFAWQQIIRAVGTRSEKQVKAYAARYRRRKKLEAQAHIHPTHPSSNLSPCLAPALSHASSPYTTSASDDSVSRSDTPAEQPLHLHDQPHHLLSDLPHPAPPNDDVSTYLADGFRNLDPLDSVGTKLETSVLDDAFDRHDNDPAPPTEVALLLDQALDGDLLMHAQSARSRPEDVAEEGYPAEFINAVFSQ